VVIMAEKDYISFLEAAAHGLSNRLTEAEGLLLMAMNFMTSVEYDTTVDALQCVGIARTIKEFLSDKVESE
jgi:hypothetical protein